MPPLKNFRKCSYNPIAPTPRFVYKDSLNQHMLTHTDVATVDCPICGKGFKQRGSMYKHKAMHGPGKYICDTCGRRFDRKEYLLAHLKTHGDKQQCGACKIMVYHLDKHICKADKADPQHYCTICGMSFRQKRYLYEHIRYNHKMRSDLFKCQICEKTFKYRGSLYNHKKFCKLPNQNFTFKTDATDDNLSTEDVSQDAQDISQDEHDISLDTQDISQDIRDISQDTQDISQDTQDISQDEQDISLDTQDISQDIWDISQDTQDISQDAQDISKDTQDISQDTQDISQDAQDISQDAQDISQDDTCTPASDNIPWAFNIIS